MATPKTILAGMPVSYIMRIASALNLSMYDCELFFCADAAKVEINSAVISKIFFIIIFF